ncbi:MAG: outer membrane lipoprotein-sorting protein [Deltaproteobacteria bacterium]|nr:outer membrane lipoprotein-sorting protein [Deltaproteobacteria bacterium]
MSNRLFFPTAFAACMLLASCGPHLYPVPRNPITEPSVLLNRLDEHAGRFNRLSAVARLSSKSEQGSVRGRITVLADIGGRLRVDGWTPTDSLVATLTAGPEDFHYFERGAGECLTGRSCPENLALLLPVGMEVRPTVGFLFGIPPIRPAPDWTMSFDRRSGAYELVSRIRGGDWQRVWIREDGIPVAAEFIEDEKLVFRMNASDFRKVSGRVFPMKVSLHATREDSSLTIKYRSVDLDPVIRDEDWDFTCPEGMGLRVVHCRDE